jgi:hypothetical protein
MRREIKSCLLTTSMIIGAGLAVVACGPRVENRSSATAVTTDTGQGTFLISHDSNNDAPDSYIFRDKLTGCEYVVWMWNGLSSQPRMEKGPSGQPVQRCQGGQTTPTTGQR